MYITQTCTCYDTCINIILFVQPRYAASRLVNLALCVHLHMRACVCVCVREREREKICNWDWKILFFPIYCICHGISADHVVILSF
jgi:hypothetical protein